MAFTVRALRRRRGCCPVGRSDGALVRNRNMPWTSLNCGKPESQSHPPRGSPRVAPVCFAVVDQALLARADAAERNAHNMEDALEVHRPELAVGRVAMIEQPRKPSDLPRGDYHVRIAHGQGVGIVVTVFELLTRRIETHLPGKRAHEGSDTRLHRFTGCAAHQSSVFAQRQTRVDGC